MRGQKNIPFFGAPKTVYFSSLGVASGTAPRRPQDAPRSSKPPSDGPEMRPESSKSRPRPLQAAPRRPEDRPKTLQDPPRRLPTAPRWPQDGSKTPPRLPKTAPRRPHDTEGGRCEATKIYLFSGRQKRYIFLAWGWLPGRPQDAPKTPQDRFSTIFLPKIASRIPKIN